MFTKKSIPMLVMAVGLMALGVSEAGATSSLLPFTPVDPPRTCSLTIGELSSVEIVAGPADPGNSSNTLAANFPFVGPCPSPIAGNCLVREYKWIGASGIANVYTSWSSDIEVLAAERWDGVSWVAISPAISMFPGGDDVTKAGQNMADGTFARYFKGEAGTSSNFAVRYFTRLGIGDGTTTAGFSGFGSRRISSAFCPILGAAEQGDNDPLLAVTAKTIEDIGACTVELEKDAKGCVVGVIITDDPGGQCVFSDNETVEVNGDIALAIDCGAKITADGSSKFCWVKANGKMACVTF